MQNLEVAANSLVLIDMLEMIELCRQNPEILKLLQGELRRIQNKKILNQLSEYISAILPESRGRGREVLLKINAVIKNLISFSKKPEIQLAYNTAKALAEIIGFSATGPYGALIELVSSVLRFVISKVKEKGHK